MDAFGLVPMLTFLHIVLQVSSSAEPPTQPKLSVEPEYQEFCEGEKIRLICSTSQNLTVPQNRTVKGYRFLQEDGQTYQMAPNAYNRGVMYFQAQRNYTGNYNCAYWLEETGRKVWSIQSHTIRIQVNEDLTQPKLSVDPEYQEYYEGEEIKLTCSTFRNMSLPRNCAVKGYQFFQEHGQIHQRAPNAYRDGVMKFQAEREKAGNYNCAYWLEEAGRKVWSNQSHTISIQVNAAPAAPSLNYLTFDCGSSVSLKCSAPPEVNDVREFHFITDRMAFLVGANASNSYTYNLTNVAFKEVGIVKCAYVLYLHGRNVFSRNSDSIFIKAVGWIRLFGVGGSFFTINGLIFLISYCISLRNRAPPFHLLNATTNDCLLTSGNSTLLSSSTSSVTGIVFLLLAALIGLPGNFFVIWSILWKMKPSHRSVTCLLVLNLAVADGVVLLLTPFFVLFLIFKNWLFGWAICKGVYYLCCINMFASIFIITLMSADRCLAVNQPYYSQAIRKKNLVVKILVGIWTGAILLSLPAFFFRQVLEEPSGKHFICEPCHSRKSLTIFHFTMETVVAFVIPFTIIVGCYSAILVRLRGVRKRKGARTEKLIVAIVICFAVLWTPYHVINMIQVASNLTSGKMADRLGQAWKNGRAGATALAFLSSSINPVLYVFAAGNLIKTSGANFIAQFFEGASEGLGRRSQSQKNLDKDLIPAVGASVNLDQQLLGNCDKVNKGTDCRLNDGTTHNIS